jgi:SAM-dependent methyltransferase
VVDTTPMSQRGVELPRRYTKGDLSILTEEEACRFVGDGDCGPRDDIALAWELLYRLEPELYDRLVQAERIHPAILGWLPRHVARIVEVAPGTGRLTAALLERCDHLIAVEPAAPLRTVLAARLRHRAAGCRLRLEHGFFDSLPVPDRSARLVITCSAFTPDPAHGGDAGLAEMERVCALGGQVVIVWPNHSEWLAEHGYRYVSFPGEMRMEFASLEEAVELSEIFYPHAVAEIRRRGEPRVPYEVLGVNPPRDLAYKEIAA